MRRQTYKFDQALIKKLVAQYEEREPSGRMSATRLLWPTQWQVLWTLGVPPTKEAFETGNPTKMNTLKLRHFARGRQCEDWLEEIFPPIEAQVLVNYRDWVGYADRIDSGDMFGVLDDLPVEVKSVKADKWYRMFIDKAGDGPQYDHVLQANFYAIGLKKKHFALLYLKSDTLETRCFVYDTDDYRKDVDKQIDLYEEALTLDTIPVFKAKVEYQKDSKYNIYSEYMNMKPDKLLEVYKKYKK